jgi:hypothetical protein
MVPIFLYSADRAVFSFRIFYYLRWKIWFQKYEMMMIHSENPIKKFPHNMDTTIHRMEIELNWKKGGKVLVDIVAHILM